MAKKTRSKRTRRTPPPAPKPKASPKWVPHVGVGLVLLGTLVVIVAFMLAVPNVISLVGFALMAGGLVTLSQWR